MGELRKSVGAPAKQLERVPTETKGVRRLANMAPQTQTQCPLLELCALIFNASSPAPQIIFPLQHLSRGKLLTACETLLYLECL